LKKNGGTDRSPLDSRQFHSVLAAVLLVSVVLLSAGSGVYASASFFPQQMPNVTITTTTFTTTTSWTTSTIWSTVTSMVYGVWTKVQYTTSTSTVTVTDVKLNDAAGSASGVGFLFCTPFTPANPITVVQLQAKFGTAGAPSSQFGVAIYDDSSNSPNNLLVSAFGSVSGTGWLTLTLTSPLHLSANTKYWLAWQNQSASNLVNYNTVADPNSVYKSCSWTGSFPNPIGTTTRNVVPIDVGYIYF
jgi:hypothetical protein